MKCQNQDTCKNKNTYSCLCCKNNTDVKSFWDFYEVKENKYD